MIFRRWSCAESTARALRQFYELQVRCGGMGLSDARRLKQPENERAKLKRLVADVMSHNAVLNDLMEKALTTPMQRWNAVLRQCRIIRFLNAGSPATCADPDRCRSDKRPPDNPEIRSEMNKIAEKWRRFSDRRIGVVLEPVWMIVNDKKIYRI